MTTPVLGPLPGSREDPNGSRFPEGAGRTIVSPAFADDDGAPKPRLVAALQAYASGAGGHADVIDALAGGRLLVPVVAVLDEAEVSPDGLRRDKTSHMATVSITGEDGRVGLLAFTGTEAMRRWDPSARPVAVSARRAAEAALADGTQALVLDIAGPVSFAIEAADLRALAAGYRSPVDTGDIPVWAVAVGLARLESGPEAVDAPEPLTSTGHGWLSRLRDRRQA